MSREKQQLPQGRGKERKGQAIQSSGDFVYLVPDGRPSSKMKLYVLKQDFSVVTKNSNGDVFNPLTFTERAEREV